MFNTFVVWTLTGIWHGANWTFLLWGLMYFVLIAFEKLTGLPQKIKNTFGKVVYRLFTLGSVLGGWIIFRAATLGTILRYVKNMLGLGAGGWHDDRLNLYLSENAVFYVVALLLSVPLFSMLEHKIKKNAKAENVWGIAKPVLLLLIFLISISYLVINSYSPFIYFNF